MPVLDPFRRDRIHRSLSALIRARPGCFRLDAETTREVERQFDRMIAAAES
jgi:hypothetical protein